MNLNGIRYIQSRITDVKAIAFGNLSDEIFLLTLQAGGNQHEEINYYSLRRCFDCSRSGVTVGQEFHLYGFLGRGLLRGLLDSSATEKEARCTLFLLVLKFYFLLGVGEIDIYTKHNPEYQC